MISFPNLARLSGAMLLLSSQTSFAAEHCSDAYYIDRTLTNGARWDMCWTHKQREGIILKDIYYTPKDGTREKVLEAAGVSQIHVPYDDDGARYHDVSDYGIGGNKLNDLTSADCPNGELVKYLSKDAICLETNAPYGHAWKSEEEGLQGTSLKLFSVSHVGAYNYIPQWEFQDNGTIIPQMGATGQLQRISSSPTHAWDLGNNRHGISHLHNYYWKLDFDLGSNRTDETIEELNFLTQGNKRIRSTTVFSEEIGRSVNPETLRTWRIKDGLLTNAKGSPKSWDIELNDTGHKDIGPSFEPWSFNDFYVTKEKSCEIYASHNPSSSCGDNLDEFVNGQSLDGADKVIWVGLTFHHVPRSEDDPQMYAHWNSFRIIPRDWHAIHPLAPEITNNPPTVSNPGNQSSEVGQSVNLLIGASDEDDDSLTFSAENLPGGLNIDRDSGLITGTLTPLAEGTHQTTVYVSDGTDATGITFSFQIAAAPPTGSDNISNLVTSLTMDGNQLDWESLEKFTNDPNDIDSAHEIDWLQASMAHSNSTIYLSYNNDGSIVRNNFWAWLTLLDTDSDRSTGFRWGSAGVDYMVEGAALYKYTGSGYNWEWQHIDPLNKGYTGGFVEMEIPRQLIGNPTDTMSVFFAGMNQHITNGPNDSYPNGDGDNLLTYTLGDITPPPTNTITIDGDQSDWATVTSWTDPDDVSDSSMVDWRKVWFTLGDDNASIAYENEDDIVGSKFWSWQVYIDTDTNTSTGYNWGSSGSEYLVEGGALFQYTGNGSNWSWTQVGSVSYNKNGNFVEMSIPESSLGNPSSYRLYFYGANQHFNSTEDTLLVTP